MTQTIGSIDITPSPEGFAQIAHTFVQNVLGDVRKARQSDSRALMVEAIKIAAHLRAVGRDDLLARLLVAIEQDEPIAFAVEPLTYSPPNSPVSYNADYPDGEEPTCDICGRAMDDSPSGEPSGGNWNGETGNHLSCERA